MRLDFNVLWVDDQPNSVTAQISAIKRQMLDEGFSFNANLCESVDKVTERIADDVFSDEVDLILVDWDLGETTKGQNVISQIREHIQYKDVVFYSAQITAENLRELAFNTGLEGVFCASREDLVDEVMGVFESLVKKVLDLDHTRGIVMGATSDIDWMARECLTAMHDRLDDVGRKSILDEAIDRISAQLEEFSSKVAEIKDNPNFTSILDSHAVFTANDRLRLLSNLLKLVSFEDLAAHRPAVNSYIQDVVPKRNVLGHLVLSPEGKPQAIADDAGNEVGLEEMRDLRCNLLNLRGEFRTLHGALQ